ncbi:MAG TPA: amidohydrolase family protein [Rhizobium sp.]
MTTQTTTWSIIDFHAHIRPSWWQHAPLDAAEIDPEERAKRLARFKKLVDVDLLVRESEEGDVALRLLSSTIEGFFGTEGPTDIGEIRRVNDFLAEVQTKHSGRLAALATVDAYSGDEAAREAERAIVELGHVGIVIDSSRDQKFLSAPEVRPTLEVAAKYKVPVLVHPVGAPNSNKLTHGGGVAAYSFGRGLVNGAAFFSALKAGIFEQLPDLHLVFTAIATGALVIAAAETEHYSEEARARGNLPNAYFDIMGLNPQTIRYLVDFLGADRVLAGSDWPIWAPITRSTLSTAFKNAGLTPEQQKAIAEGNAKRLLGLRSA